MNCFNRLEKRIEQLNSIGMVKRFLWEDWLGLAEEYFRENGYSMGNWVCMQRSHLKQENYGGLDAGQRLALQKIGIVPWGEKA